MFGYVSANLPELTKEEKTRYSAAYCGICRQIRSVASQTARLCLSYDMAFLALLLMSLYEPEEASGKPACLLHPTRPYLAGEILDYAADMNVALAYYKCLDDTRDEGKYTAKLAAGVLKKALPGIWKKWPRQCAAIENCLDKLSQLEQKNCQNPDEAAACFGALMGELFVYRQDLWENTLRQMGMALGRYIYLADAAVDYKKDRKTGSYNPFLAMGMKEDPTQWEQYLVLAMSRCTSYYERLPLVQDKKLLDNILYSGIWVEYRRRQGSKTPSREVSNDQ